MTQSQLIEKQRKFLLICAERKGIAQACRTFGISRTAFYKIKKQFVETGSVAPKMRRKPRMPNETALSKKKLLLKLVQENPNWGPLRYREALRRLHGIELATSCVWYHLRRFGLNNRYRRLVYLEELKHQNQPLTERTLKQVRVAFHSMDRGLWPGHRVALDTFYVGNLKGVGRIYQITGLDLCSRFGWARLYRSKEQEVSIDFVENHLIPKFYHNNVDLEAVLTDHGSEFKARGFEQMLEDYGIEHRFIPKGKPMYNGYCERFQRTIFEEFYQRVFRLKFFENLESLQKDLDDYLIFYNFQRVHFGLDPNGSIPIQALKAKRSFMQQRFQKLLT